MSNDNMSNDNSSMNVKDRIEQALACEVINLTEPEKDLYSGAGRKVARFENGQLVELFDPLSHAAAYDEPEKAANDALAETIKWASAAKGELWTVMCSCYQLCEPEIFSVTDAAAVAKLARQIGEDIAEL